jgi:MaoC dehydratase-like protein
MAESIVITDEMQAVIGQESPSWPYEVTTTGIRAFARGVGYDDLVYFDAAEAEAAGYDRLPAPPCYLGTPVFIPGRSSDRFSGPLASTPSIRHGLTDVLDGGTETVYERPVVVGDTLTATAAITGLEVKQSRALGAMLLVSAETVYRDGDGDVVARQRGQAIYY